MEWTDLDAVMAEAIGGAVLQEFVLDERLKRELTERGLRISPELVEAERGYLVEGLRAGAVSAGEATDELVLELRRRQGLGDRRFAALLERTAGLRALVRDEVRVNPEALAQAHALVDGPKYRVRLLVVPTQAQAASLRTEIGSSSSPGQTFAARASQVSTDSTASRGGLLEPFSPDDPAYASVIRSEVKGLKPGEIGQVVALERGFGLVYLEEVLPGTGRTLDQARGELEAFVRRRQERLLMESLASRLLDGGRGVRVLDSSLSWSWSGLDRAGK